MIQASKLQTTTIEIMDAVELEKQKHNTTRKEALTRLAKLEVLQSTKHLPWLGFCMG